MRWFAFEPAKSKPNCVIVQAKNLDSARKRLARWKSITNTEMSDTVLNNGVGYQTMTEAWHRCGNITMVGSDY